MPNKATPANRPVRRRKSVTHYSDDNPNTFTVKKKKRKNAADHNDDDDDDERKPSPQQPVQKSQRGRRRKNSTTPTATSARSQPKSSAAAAAAAPPKSRRGRSKSPGNNNSSNNNNNNNNNETISSLDTFAALAAATRNRHSGRGSKLVNNSGGNKNGRNNSNTASANPYNMNAVSFYGSSSFPRKRKSVADNNSTSNDNNATNKEDGIPHPHQDEQEAVIEEDDMIISHRTTIQYRLPLHTISTLTSSTAPTSAYSMFSSAARACLSENYLSKSIPTSQAQSWQIIENTASTTITTTADQTTLNPTAVSSSSAINTTNTTSTSSAGAASAPTMITWYSIRLDDDKYALAGDCFGQVLLYNHYQKYPIKVLQSTSAYQREQQRIITSKKVIRFPNAIVQCAWHSNVVVVLTTQELQFISINDTILHTISPIMSTWPDTSQYAKKIMTQQSPNLQLTSCCNTTNKNKNQKYQLLWTTWHRQIQIEIDDHDNDDSKNINITNNSLLLFDILYDPAKCERIIGDTGTGNGGNNDNNNNDKTKLVQQSNVIHKLTPKNSSDNDNNTTPCFRCWTSLWEKTNNNNNNNNTFLIIAQTGSDTIELIRGKVLQQKSNTNNNNNNTIYTTTTTANLSPDNDIITTISNNKDNDSNHNGDNHDKGNDNGNDGADKNNNGNDGTNKSNDDIKASPITVLETEFDVLVRHTLPFSSGRGGCYSIHSVTSELMPAQDCCIQQMDGDENDNNSKTFVTGVVCRGIRVFLTETLTPIATFGETVQLHGKMVVWNRCSWIDAPIVQDQIRVEPVAATTTTNATNTGGKKKQAWWVEHDDVLQQSSVGDKTNNSSGDISSNGHTSDDNYCEKWLIGIPHPFRGPAELKSTLYIWKPATTASRTTARYTENTITIHGPIGGCTGDLFCCPVNNGVFRMVCVGAEDGQLYEWTASSMRTDFAGIMYPVGYRTITDNVEYMEAEDELDHHQQPQYISSALTSNKMTHSENTIQSSAGGKVVDSTVDPDLAEAMRLSLLEHKEQIKKAEQEKEDIKISVLAKDNDSFMVPCWPELRETNDSKSTCPGSPRPPNIARNDRTTNNFDQEHVFEQGYLNAMPHVTREIEKEIKEIEDKRAQQPDIADTSVLPDRPKARGKRSRYANVELLMQSSVDQDLRRKIFTLRGMWTDGIGSSIQASELQILPDDDDDDDDDAVLEPPSVKRTKTEPSTETVKKEAMDIQSSQKGGGDATTTLPDGVSTKLAPDTKDTVVTPSEVSPTHAPTTNQTITTLENSEGEVSISNTADNNTKTDDNIFEKHQESEEDEEEKEVAVETLCSACHGRLVRHTCGKREQPVDYDAIARAEQERKDREAAEKHRARAERRRIAEARRREAKKKKKMEEERKQQEEEERKRRLEEERLQRERTIEQEREKAYAERRGWTNTSYPNSSSPHDIGSLDRAAAAVAYENGGTYASSIHSEPERKYRGDTPRQETRAVSDQGRYFNENSRMDSYGSGHSWTSGRHASVSSSTRETFNINGNEVEASASLDPTDALAALAGLADSLSKPPEDEAGGHQHDPGSTWNNQTQGQSITNYQPNQTNNDNDPANGSAGWTARESSSQQQQTSGSPNRNAPVYTREYTSEPNSNLNKYNNEHSINTQSVTDSRQHIYEYHGSEQRRADIAQALSALSGDTNMDTSTNQSNAVAPRRASSAPAAAPAQIIYENNVPADASNSTQQIIYSETSIEVPSQRTPTVPVTANHHNTINIAQAAQANALPSHAPTHAMQQDQLTQTSDRPIHGFGSQPQHRPFSAEPKLEHVPKPVVTQPDIGNGNQQQQQNANPGKSNQDDDVGKVAGLLIQHEGKEIDR